MSKFAAALSVAALIVYGLSYLIDYACNGCLQERQPVECLDHRSNPISWWQCSKELQRAAHNTGSN